MTDPNQIASSEREPELLNATLERTDLWRVHYAYFGSDDAWFEYIGTWPELMTMMAENLREVRHMEIKHYGRTVRAVLSALREPDEGMIEAGRGMTPYPRTIWQVMIDQALKG